MTYEKFKTQHETKNKNEENVLKNLYNNPMRFKDLKEETGLSQMGLTAVLKRLITEGKIEKIMYEGHESYALTKDGQDYLKGMWMILHEIYEMQDVKTTYKSNYFSTSDIKWSLLTEVESPLFNYSEFIDKFSEDYLRMILQNIKEKYLVKNEGQSYSIREPEKIRGKHIIAFEVDFDLIRKNLDDALKPVSMGNKDKIGEYQPIANAIKEDIRNHYKNILFNEDRTSIFHSKIDNEEDNKEDDLQ